MRNFLNHLGIYNDGTQLNGKYVINFNNIDEFNKVFKKLDKSNEIEESEESSILNSSVSTIVYNNDDYLIILSANFDTDEYTLTIQDIGR